MRLLRFTAWCSPSCQRCSSIRLRELDLKKAERNGPTPGKASKKALTSVFNPMRIMTEAATPLRSDSMITTALTLEDRKSPTPGTKARKGSSPTLKFVPGICSRSSSHLATILAVALRSDSVLPGGRMPCACGCGGITSSGSIGSGMGNDERRTCAWRGVMQSLKGGSGCSVYRSTVYPKKDDSPPNSRPSSCLV